MSATQFQNLLDIFAYSVIGHLFVDFANRGCMNGGTYLQDLDGRNGK